MVHSQEMLEMFTVRRGFALMLTIVPILSLMSCGMGNSPATKTQCQAFRKSMERFATKAESLNQEQLKLSRAGAANSSEMQALAQRSISLYGDSAKAFQDLKIQDKKLQGYRKRMVASLTTQKTVLESFLNPNPQSMNFKMETVHESLGEMLKVFWEVNTYCG
jgi:hypothetical protein